MKKSTHLLPLLLFLALPFFSRSQFSFYRTDSIPVIHAGDTLDYAWAGGLNQPKFSTIDLDGDGIKDLFVYDRPYDQVLTFINKGTPNQVDYVYDPSYEKYFPPLDAWALLRDYNCDGKEDIFTWYPGGIQIWRNVSDTSIQFEKVVDQLRDPQCGTNLNVLVTSVDLPSIEDMDNDGDLDILVYDQFGIYVEYHKNYSIEMGYGCDSLKFELKNQSWGHFYEDNDSCYIKLNQSITLCPENGSPEMGPYDPAIYGSQTMDENTLRATRHTGSSLLAIDINGKNSKDLLMGDVSCNNLYMLLNSGAAPNLNSPMASVDTTFPSYDTPVDMFTFPAPYYVDVNNDGKRDLVVATYEPTWTDTDHGVWLYTNTSTDSTPVFDLTEKGFMQNDMIERGEGAFPVFMDYDNDGLQDLVVGNHGFFDPDTVEVLSKLALYKNTGTAAKAVFTLVDPNFADLPSVIDKVSLYPAFADLDNDGDQDMLLGDIDGRIHRFVNTAGPGVVPNLVPFQMNMTDASSAIMDVGRYSTPHLVDIDRDGDKDLIVGEYNAVLNYYQNTGTASAPVFKFITDFFGQVKVNEYWTPVGFSVPSFYDDAGEWYLAVGSQKGVVYTYTHIDGNLGGAFTLSDSLFYDMRIGGRLAPALARLNGDDKPDLVTGNYRGGLALCYASADVDSTIGIHENTSPVLIHFQVYPNPASASIRLATNLEGTYAYFITDINGKTVAQGDFYGATKELDIHHLDNGLYFIHLSNCFSRMTQKFVKQAHR